ncbi:hypothetical protein Patl1_29391 [Pistacia atlantica]|uniref:Uncharacterized protein n=1 Tax=Pistacia atlantica TaxID=434234 RepID=A0ACC1AB47_9ROSI|nr:hypothetical protein Patl1_29391 [Pistacia atlantica]
MSKIQRLLLQKFTLTSSLQTLRTLHTLQVSRNPSTESVSDSFLVEKILFNLKQWNVNSLRHYQFRLNPVTAVEVLYRLRDNLHLGQRFIDFIALNCANFKHSSLSLSAMIHILVRSRRLSDAQALILRMVRKSGVSRVEIVESLVSTYKNCGSNELVFDLFIRTYVQARKLREGSEAFLVLRNKGICVSINACNSLLGGLVKIGWVDLAWQVYAEVDRSDLVSFSSLIGVFSRSGQLDRALMYFRHMKSAGVAPDTVVYTILIDGLWYEMVRKGIKPTLVTCNIIIKGYCRSGDASKADEFLSKMISEGVVPDSITYNTLINGFVKEENMDRVSVLVSKMENQGLLPDVITYNVILSGFCRQGNMQEAQLVLRRMIEKGVNPDRSTYTSLINGHVSQNNLKEAFRFHDEMLQRGFAPDDKF